MDIIRKLITEAFQNMYTDPDLCISKSQEALYIAKEQNNEEAIGMALMHIGLGHYYKAEYDKAVRNYLIAEDFLIAANYLHGLRALYNNLGVVYSLFDDLEKQLYYFEKNLALSKNADRPENTETIFANIGQIYVSKRDFVSGENFLNKALEANTFTGNKYIEATILSSLSTISMAKKNYMQADELLRQSLQIRNEINDNKGIIRSFVALIDLELEIGALDLAEHLIHTTLKLCEQEEDFRRMALLYFQKAKIANSKKDFKSEEKIIQKIIIITQKHSLKTLLMRALKKLKMHYERQEDYKSAYFCTKKIDLLQDELSERDKRIRKAEIDAKFENHRLLNEKEIIADKNKKLEIAIEKRKELVHVLCHDLANPIFLILTALDLIELGDNIEDYTKMIRTATEDCIDIMELVRLMEAMEDNKLRFSLASLNITEIMKNTIESLQFKIKRKKLEIIFEAQKDIYIQAEKTSLQHSVIKNVLTNSIKFSEKNSKIIVRLQENKENVTIEVEDFGIGIPEKIMNKIFSSDKHTNRLGTQGEKGTGFGMPLVKYFMKLYNGSIEILSHSNCSTKEKGTIVKLSFQQTL